MTDKIKEAAEKYAFRVPYDGSNNFYNEDRYKGFIAGATSEAAREYWDGQGWVRVDDGLPEDNEDYQVWVKGEIIPLVAYLLTKKYFLENYEDENYMEEGWYLSKAYDEAHEYPLSVTHWRPLPAPPTQ